MAQRLLKGSIVPSGSAVCRQGNKAESGVCGGTQEERESVGAGSSLPANMVVPTCMARGLGSSGGATLQRSKLDLKQETKTLEPRVDNSGGGGNNGKNIFNGGGGGDDGGDGELLA